MHELKNVKTKLIEALEEMGKDRQAMNDPAVERICRISKALKDIATFEAMEDHSGEGYSSRGRSYADGHNGASYGNDWEHGGNYREQTSRNNGNSYADRSQARRELERQLDRMNISREERERLMNTVENM